MITLKKSFSAALAALVISGLGLAACEKAADGGSSPPTSDDSDTGGGASTVPTLPALSGPMFSPDLVDRVGSLDLFAMAESRIALARSQNSNVKSFAQAAIDAHSKSLAGLGAAIDASNQTISTPDSMPNDLAAKASDLQKVEAAQFDKTYLGDQIAALQAANNALKTFAKHGDASQFKAYAEKTLPGVESSLANAQTLQSSLK